MIQPGRKNQKKNPDRVDITGWTAKPLIFRPFWASSVGGELSTIDKASTATDSSTDTFCIRSWWEDASGKHVVYDNGVAQAIGGGNIEVHTSK